MTPIQHESCNAVLKCPEGMSKEQCADLPITRRDGLVLSFWKPSPREIAAIIDGGHVALIVAGETHPPLSVTIIENPNPPGHELTPETAIDRYKLLREYSGQVVNLVKQLLSHTAKHIPDHPETDRLCNELLDLCGKPEGK